MSAKRKHRPPFKEKEWVTPTDKTHPMYRKRAVVRRVEYVGQGVTEQFLVTVLFENVPASQQKEWTFRHQELKPCPSAEVAAPHRRNFGW